MPAHPGPVASLLMRRFGSTVAVDLLPHGRPRIDGEEFIPVAMSEPRLDFVTIPPKAPTDSHRLRPDLSGGLMAVKGARPHRHHRREHLAVDHDW